MENRPSFYAIIPANVRYDKELTPNAKLLYGEITALCSDKGYCWATNKYFSELYDVSVTSISKWVSQLVNKGYLTIKINYKEGTKEILNRYLSLVKHPIEEKLNTPIEEKLIDINTINNNTFINTNNIKYNHLFISKAKAFDIFWNTYNKKLDRSNSEKKFNKLSIKEIETILKVVNNYVKSTPDVKYRKNPMTWLNGKNWNDEVEINKPQTQSQTNEQLYQQITKVPL